MTRFTARAAALVAVIFVFNFLILSSCAENGIQINARREVFTASAGAKSASLQNGGETEQTAVKPLPENYAGADYKEQYNQPDRLTETAKAFLSASGEAIAFVNAKNSYERGEAVVLSVACAPDTVYTLKIRYKSGYSSARGLGETTSDAHGYATWKFKIGNVASSDEFTPWFEVSGGGATVIHSFEIGGGTAAKTESAPKSEGAVFAAEALVLKISAPETPADESEEPDESDKTERTDNRADKKPETSAPGVKTKPAETVPAVKPSGTAIKFINARATYYRGETVTLTICGAPGTVYTLKVRFKSGYSTAKGLGEVRSDAGGAASWTFKITANVAVDFEPWFEVAGGGETAQRAFKIDDYKPIETEAARPTPAPETKASAETKAPPETAEIKGGGAIVFSEVKPSYSRGENVTLTISGLPDTVYTLKIMYKSGYSTAKGLGETKSDARGAASWTFKIGSRADTVFTAYFEISGGGETVIQYFSVTD